jgi:hypothetical protein
MYGKEKQCYFPHHLPMDSDNGFKKSNWIGQQRVWASTPPALRKIAAQYLIGAFHKLRSSLTSPEALAGLRDL